MDITTQGNKRNKSDIDTGKQWEEKEKTKKLALKEHFSLILQTEKAIWQLELLDSVAFVAVVAVNVAKVGMMDVLVAKVALMYSKSTKVGTCSWSDL